MNRDTICGRTVHPDIALQSGAMVRLTIFEATNVEQFLAAPVGYEELLYDCIVGDATHFRRADMVEAAWKVADPILET